MVGIFELEDYTGKLLDASRFRDYCPNGLQVEGRPSIKRLVTGVSASLALLHAALDANAGAILVHHGWFWRNEDARVVGVKRTRLGLLIEQGVSLFAYHLPLDAHPELGNNAQLAKRLGMTVEGWFGEQNVAAHGSLGVPTKLADFAVRVESALSRKPLVIGEAERVVKRIAWCSGAAQDYFGEALKYGVDAFITGEISEHSVHLAHESGVAFISAGHHATERYGVQALGEHLASQFGLEHRFIDIDNPV
jgi:dinuclear metal center YbgI/SA1388 family protein